MIALVLVGAGSPSERSCDSLPAPTAGRADAARGRNGHHHGIDLVPEYQQALQRRFEERAGHALGVDCIDRPVDCAAVVEGVAAAVRDPRFCRLSGVSVRVPQTPASAALSMSGPGSSASASWRADRRRALRA